MCGSYPFHFNCIYGIVAEIFKEEDQHEIMGIYNKPRIPNKISNRLAKSELFKDVNGEDQHFTDLNIFFYTEERRSI